ncbi:MAG: TlpA family protein disulfide reductase [Pyrinomonadaceae bacterium]
MKNILPLILLSLMSATAFAQQSVGAAAQPFSEKNLSGEIVDLQAQKGKVVLMAFWSTKCEICESEIPKLNNLASKYRTKNVEFLGITMNPPKMVRAYLKEKPFNFNIIPNAFGIILKYADRTSDGKINMGFPAYFLINQSGTVILKSSGFNKTGELDSKLDELLEKE